MPEKESSKSERTTSPASLSRWLVAAFGAMGLATGLAAGLSSTPVVNNWLPLLFGAIGGGGAFFAVVRPEHSRVVGVCLTLFAMCTIFGTLQGICLRTNQPWSSVLSSNLSAEEVSVQLPDGFAKRLAMLRLRSLINERWYDPETLAERQELLRAAGELDEAQLIEALRRLGAQDTMTALDSGISLAERPVELWENDTKGD